MSEIDLTSRVARRFLVREKAMIEQVAPVALQGTSPKSMTLVEADTYCSGEDLRIAGCWVQIGNASQTVRIAYEGSGRRYVIYDQQVPEKLLGLLRAEEAKNRVAEVVGELIESGLSWNDAFDASFAVSQQIAYLVLTDTSTESLKKAME